jgi:hypothetical protein
MTEVKDMVGDISQSIRLNRLEDCIVQAKKGKKIQVESELRKEKIIRQNGQCTKTEGKVDGYLFIADFQCTMDNRTYIVSKVYSLSYLTGDPNDMHVDRQVANARLRMDYSRLQEAGIEVWEKYFPESECL